MTYGPTVEKVAMIVCDKGNCPGVPLLEVIAGLKMEFEAEFRVYMKSPIDWDKVKDLLYSYRWNHVSLEKTTIAIIAEVFIDDIERTLKQLEFFKV